MIIFDIVKIVCHFDQIELRIILINPLGIKIKVTYAYCVTRNIRDSLLINKMNVYDLKVIAPLLKGVSYLCYLH